MLTANTLIFTTLFVSTSVSVDADAKTPNSESAPLQTPVQAPAPAVDSSSSSKTASTPPSAPVEQGGTVATPASDSSPNATPDTENKKSRDDKPDVRYKTPMGTKIGIGASAGLTSGIGISVRRHFESRFGFHVGALGYWTSESNRWGNIGVEGFYTLKRSRRARLYALLGAQLLFKSEPSPGDDTPGGKAVTYRDPTPTLAVGPGVGIEVHFTKHFGWAFEAPLAVVIALDNETDRLPFGGKVNFIPALNTAFTFYF